ncbi:Predicted acetyltransferase, GNAT superfamily [Oceanobacillus limi]|uniref:Predicted acetyltransferase, GNAT superfamily n=1 Tax=Oceanobacillus limi TaxID=930131 RepID=A0A1I0AEU0_9BACI|nr:GNAT family N-acetyltransferase [Oceanobacillus limi]SES92693.1 Predicted acetyltransferase, GNAT superfamily [Oceanobacillus limi]
MGIQIRRLTTIEELYQMAEVEEAVWVAPPTPIHQTYTASYNGGLMLGAFDGDKMIGFQYSFAGFDGKKPYLCSHMLGILPAYRGRGLGVKMKQKQAEVAREMGYEMMTWTFDPLESLNAYLNLHKLGGVGAAYKVNHYGMMDDGLNTGLPTDRIQIEWWFNEENLSYDADALAEENLLLEVNSKGEPVKTKHFTDKLDHEKDFWFVAVPSSFQQLKKRNQELAIVWRYETREVFQALFHHGYKATDLVRHEGASYYYFTKK